VGTSRDLILGLPDVKRKGSRMKAICERSVGTVFQLPSPDAIYSRDEEKNGNVGGLPDCLGWRTAHILPVEGVIEGRKRLGRWPSHVTSGSARYTIGQYIEILK
jgi:hypothetical protein